MDKILNPKDDILQIVQEFIDFIEKVDKGDSEDDNSIQNS